jgi:hypothetical protein
VTKHLTETTQERKNFFWIMVSEVSVHHNGKNMEEQSSSYHGSQEAERERKELGTRYNLQKHDPKTYFLQLGLTS